MIKCLHFNEFEIASFLTFCDKHPDIEYRLRLTNDKKQKFSVNMKYNNAETDNDIYKKVAELRG